MDVSPKTVLVTGGATGIGLASAHAFSKAGYNVVLTDLEQKVVQDAANTIKGPTLAIKLDVCDQTSIYVAFKELNSETALSSSVFSGFAHLGHCVCSLALKPCPHLSQSISLTLRILLSNEVDIVH